MDAEFASLTDKLHEQVQVCLCKEAVSELDGDDSYGRDLGFGRRIFFNFGAWGALGAGRGCSSRFAGAWGLEKTPAALLTLAYSCQAMGYRVFGRRERQWKAPLWDCLVP